MKAIGGESAAAWNEAKRRVLEQIAIVVARVSGLIRFAARVLVAAPLLAVNACGEEDDVVVVVVVVEMVEGVARE